MSVAHFSCPCPCECNLVKVKASSRHIPRAHTPCQSSDTINKVFRHLARISQRIQRRSMGIPVQLQLVYHMHEHMIFGCELETSQRSRECQCRTTSISRNHFQPKPHNLHQSSSLQKQPGFIQRAQESIRSFQAFKHSLQKRQIGLGSWQYSLELEDEKLDDEGCVSPFKPLPWPQKRDRRCTKKSTTMFDKSNYNELQKDAKLWRHPVG